MRWRHDQRRSAPASAPLQPRRIAASVWVSTADSASSSTTTCGPARQRPGDRRALLLPAREVDPALAEHRVVARREGLDRLVELRHPRRGRRRRPGRELAQRDVLAAWSGRTGTSPAARTRPPAAARRATAPASGTPSSRIPPRSGSASRATISTSVVLPAPVAPTTATHEPGGAVKETPSQRPAAVAARSLAGRAPDSGTTRPRNSTARPPRDGGERPRLRRARDRRPLVHELLDPVHRRRAALEEVDHPSERDHRPDQQHQIGRERDVRRPA